MLRYIYVVKSGDYHYKVGIAVDVKSRLSSIQTGSPQKLQVIMAAPVDEALNVERQLHQWLREWKSDGGKEWFKLDPEKALELVAKVTRMNMDSDLTDFINYHNLKQQQKVLEQRMDALATIVRKLPTVTEVEEFNSAKKQWEERRDDDTYYEQAKQFVIKRGQASTSSLQRHLSIGYSKAAKLMDRLEANGIIGPQDGSRARDVFNN